jgi:hypothetical protein
MKADQLEKAAQAVDRASRGRVSAILFLGILGVPLGCAFLVGFLVVALLVGGVLGLIGMGNVLAGQIALVAAFLGGGALVVVVYRKVIPRLPWLQRLINK